MSGTWLHLRCGGRVFWDHSGGFCSGCEAEGLQVEEAELADPGPIPVVEA